MTVTSWGRWGPDDELGALHRVDTEARQRGVAAIREFRTISLAIPISAATTPYASMRTPPLHLMARDGGDYAAGRPERGGFGYADDYIMVACHGTTHLDALSHVWQDGLMYNGFSADTVTSSGALRCGIDQVGPIVTRGIFVDISDAPSAPRVLVHDLRRAVEATGLALAPGDALLVRTGWLKAWRDGVADTASWPGLDVSCAQWLEECGVSLVGADNIGVEAFPSGVDNVQVPLHIELLRNHGVYLMELLDLEALAESGRVEFLLMVSPLPIVGGVGSPVAPVAFI